MGCKYLNKAPVPCVISMAEESTTKPRRPHTWIVRPHQLHIARGGPTAEKEFQKGVSPDMTERVVAAPTFNASYQIS